MEFVKTRSFSRAGFLGNPSDGYFGKTISFSFSEFSVELRLTESDRLRFVPGEVDDQSFDSMESLVRDLRLYGYYGGIRLLKATTKRFFEYCQSHSIRLDTRNFAVEYKISIPRLVGLSGSSAICTAMLKALCAFYEAEIPLEDAPTLCLDAERMELGIACGLQDRVVQMYNGVVFMDFDKDLVSSTGHGRYERIDPSLMPNVYVAFDPSRAEESGRAHSKVKRRFGDGDKNVVAAMSEFADIAQKGRDALLSGRTELLPGLVNANFDLRDRIFNVADENRRMVMVARSSGASAKFAGSGGAIVGTFDDEDQFSRLKEALGKIGCRTIKPTIAFDDSPAASGIGIWRNS